MIDKLRGMAIFASVVDQGSFRAAAEHLGLAPSRVSQSVSDLELKLGVTLLYRSTRRLSLTSEGQVLYNKVKQMLLAAESGLDAINLNSEQPSGDLRVTAPAFVTQTNLMDSFAAFSQKFPKIVLKMNFSDKQQDLIKDGFDVAIRAGWLSDSELMSRTLGVANRLLIASPDYVASRAAPAHPKDLETWDWVHFSVRSERVSFKSKDEESVSIQTSYHIEADSAHATYELAVRNLGLVTVPETWARNGIRRGEVVEVLPNWSLMPMDLYALWPDRSQRENLTKIFVRCLAEHQSRQLAVN